MQLNPKTALPALLAACAVLAAPSQALTTGLEPALTTVEPAEIEADVYFMASDELAGRDTPSRELLIAARFIRSRLQRLGIEPGAEDGYLHTYPLLSTAVDPEATRVTLLPGEGEEGQDLRLGEDYYYSTSSVRADASTLGTVVSCGGGSRDEVAGAGVEGAWALVFDRDGSRSSALRRNVKRAGGLGLVLVPAADFAGEPYAKRFHERTRTLVKGYVSPPGKRRRSASGSIPVVYLEREAGLRLLSSSPALPDGKQASVWEPAAGTALGVRLRDERRLAHEDGRVLLENVCGLVRGTDPELAREVILVSAHYDHVGVRGGEVYNGADDNGSGTCGLLAVADALQAYGPLRRSVLLLWVSGEEKGLWGSAGWVDDHWLPEGYRPVANLNIDMIGRNAANEIYLTPSPSHKQDNGIARLARKLAPLEGFERVRSADKYYLRSDQAEFARLDIPVAFLFAGEHEDYHRPSDTPEKLDYDKVARVARLIVRLLSAMQTDTLEF